MAKAKKDKAERNGAAKADHQHIPGMEPMPKNQRIHSAALHYAGERDARIAANRDEKAAKTTLIEEMNKANLTRYVHGSVTVDLTSQQELKVKVETAQPADEE